MNRWTHFEFESGSNPYITMTDQARKNMLRRIRYCGWTYEEIKDGFYRVYDKAA